MPIMTYLANRIEIGDRRVPYSTVSALDGPSQAAFGSLRLVDGSPAPALEEDEILLNAWAAQDLAAEVGARVELTYFEVGPREELRETTASFRLRGIVALEGLGADPTLTQEYPGIAGSDNMADWDPPFPLELGEIRSTDEDYWDRWRGTPKAFVAEAAGRRLWRTRWGELTSVRVAAAGDVERFRAGLRAALDPGAFGLRFEAVRSLGLAASRGSSDFGGLFFGMSMFIIASAALLAALLFSLGVEQRAGEIGLRLAVGEPPGKLRRRLLLEGGLLAAVGSLAGLGGAVGYAGLMMAGLRSWWRPTVGTSELYLHVTAASLLVGYLISVAVVLFAIVWTVLRIGRIPTPRLLARVAEPPLTRSGRLSRWVLLISFALAGAALAYALATGQTTNPTLFFLIGPALLIGSLALFARRIAGSSGVSLRTAGLAALFHMAAVNAGRNRGRSILSTALVASACFLIVTVAAYHKDFADKELGKDSGAGGYALVAEAAIPLHHDLNDADGRFELGLPDTVSQRLAGSRIVPFRLLPGDDASCLNLYVPGRPRIVGVPREQIERGGFRFQKALVEVGNPWTLLNAEIESEAGEVIPAIGDIASTQWILKLKLGDELVVENEYGEPIRLRLMATLAGTIFQSELLISEENFLRHFPSRTGYPYFLVETPPGATADVSQALEAGLGSYGFDALTTAEKLASFIAVQNTYLATFRTVGGLGLLLGTVGLAIVLARNVIERRRELAMLRAFGFRRSVLTSMVVIENGLLLLAGVVIGSLAALVTMAPHLLEEAAHVPWSAIGATLLGIYLFGIVTCSVAAFGALRVSLLPSLKAEH
ncbi:MAG: ABC transporter permease [bacterium]|nr:ABC transporter permease [bacterium]